MSRPAGEPAALSAAARGMAAAAEALRGTRAGLRGTTSFVVVAGAWRGPASQAFLLDGAGSQAGLDRAADAIGQTAGALAELSARLAQAQATWDRAQRLAATVGFHLDPHGTGPARPSTVEPDPRPAPAVGGGAGPPGRLLAPTGAVDLAVAAVTTQAQRLAEAAAHEAAAARRTAAARLDQATATARSIRARRDHVGHGPGPARGGHVRGPDGAAGGHPGAHDDRGPHHGGPDRRGHDRGAGDGDGEHPRDGEAHPPGDSDGHHPGHGDEHGGPVRRAVGLALEAGAELVIATHHLAAAAGARVEAAARLATTADDPAVRAAARRVVETSGRPLLDGRALGALPLVAPVLDFAAAVSHGESLPRAAAGAIGGAVGADVGGRVGLAVCGGQAAATQGAGAVVCPALTAVGGAVGAHAGKEAALRLYDAVAPEAAPEPAPPTRGSR
jgi:hypothetical protein